MSFQRATVLYPDNTVTVDTGTGINILGLIETFTSDASITSVLNNTQGSSAERAFNPVVANDVAAINAATTASKKGWAIPAGSLIVTDTVACIPFIAAQTITIAISVDYTGTGVGGGGAQDVFTPRASLWKYNPTTNVAVLIAGGSGSSQSTSALLAYGPTNFNLTVPIVIAVSTGLNLTDVLYLQIGGKLDCGAGLAGGARTFTCQLKHNTANTKMTFGTMGMAQTCFISPATIIGESVVNRGILNILESKNVIGEGVASRGIINLLKTKNVIGEGDVISSKVTIASKTTNVAGEGVISRDILDITKTHSVIGEGVASRGILDILESKSLIGEGDVSSTKLVNALKTFSLVGEGVASRDILDIVISKLTISEGIVFSVKEIVAYKTLNVVGEGDVSLVKNTIATKSFELIGESIVNYNKLVSATKSIDLISESIINMIKATQVIREFFTIGESFVDARVELPYDEIPIGGGPAPVNITIWGIFE